MPDLRYRAWRVKSAVLRRLSVARTALTRPTYRSSFYSHLGLRRRTWNALVAQRGNQSEVFPEFSKLSVHDLGRRAGVALPRLLDGPVSVDDLDLATYGPSFVIKPNWGASARGVLVLERHAEGYRDLLSGAVFDDAGVREFVRGEVAHYSKGDANDLLVEESYATAGVPPTDWKLYMFYGELGLVRQVDRGIGVTRVRTRDARWRTVRPAPRGENRDTTLADPLDPDSMCDIAQKVSLAVPTPFIRVDLFQTADSTVLGEVALLPGGDQYYGRSLDRAMGELWDDAIARLLLEGKTIIP